MNILCAGNKSPVQRSSFKNSMGNLLLILRFLGKLNNSCNFVIELSLMYVTMICRKGTYFTDLEMTEYYQKCAAEIASLQKLETTSEITPDTLC